MGQLDGEAISQDWKQVSQNMSSVSDNGSWEKPALEEIINLDDFALVAQNSLSKKNWAFISGASNDNITRDANQNDYAKILFRPKVLLDVSKVSTKTTLLGHEVPAPFMIAPAGLATTGGSEGELALSRGAGSTGIIQIVWSFKQLILSKAIQKLANCFSKQISTHASFPLVDILRAAPDHPFFFQLYINKNRHKTEQLLQTINSEPQIKAIFVTVDLPVISKREADERLKNETLRISAISGSRSSSDNKGSGLARSIGSIVDPSFTWDDLAWLRGKTQLPILLKGVQSAFDARKALAVGCDGIVISNHGGRALDSAPSSLLVLLELHKQCPEVFGTMDVFIDGGIRRGSDILKALCLGAKGVGLGRTFMYALGYGAEGVKHAINCEFGPIHIRLVSITNKTYVNSVARRIRNGYAAVRSAKPGPSEPGICEYRGVG
jgi:L-lactate dehydrogenase (cytochrome)